MTSTGVPFSNALRNLRQLGSSPVTWSFAVIILAVEVLVGLVGGRDHQPAWSWYETFGLSRAEFLAGKIWQILTYGFLHGGWWHVGLNAVFILLIALLATGFVPELLLKAIRPFAEALAALN